MIGASCSPEAVAEVPCTTCRNSGRKVSAPNIEKPTMPQHAEDERELTVAEQPQRDDRLGHPLLDLG